MVLLVRARANKLTDGRGVGGIHQGRLRTGLSARLLVCRCCGGGARRAFPRAGFCSQVSGGWEDDGGWIVDSRLCGCDENTHTLSRILIWSVGWGSDEKECIIGVDDC
jgi:hypothetical protein